MSTYWPLEDLRLRTDDLELLLPSQRQLTALAELAAEGVHRPDYMPFLTPWSATTPEGRARAVLQWHWKVFSECKPDDWNLPFVVVAGGEVVGTQSLLARDFAVTRHVSTGSWLGMRFHGRGIGTRMRAAVLEFAFRDLGAAAAHSGAFADNPASLGVSRKLGYAHNGIRTLAVQGRPRDEQRLILRREDWRYPVKLTTEGLAPCLPFLGA